METEIEKTTRSLEDLIQLNKDCKDCKFNKTPYCEHILKRDKMKENSRTYCSAWERNALFTKNTNKKH